MNLEALIVLPQVSQVIRSRAIHVVRNRFAAPDFPRALAEAVPEHRDPPAAAAAYTVKRGDFLTRIVREHLRAQGREVNNRAVLDGLKRVAAANGIQDPDLIYPGQRIDLSILDRTDGSARSAFEGKGGRVPGTAVRPRADDFTESNRVRTAIARVLDREIPSNVPATAANRQAEPWSGVLGMEARLTSPYGYRRDPFTGGMRFHHGIDLAVPTGTTVHPVGAGEVVFSGWKPGYGRVVIVRHGEGIESVYGHTSKTLVRAGEYVNPGDTIALSGSSGRSTGPHLHLEIRRDGRALNPLAYFDEDHIRLARSH